MLNLPRLRILVLVVAHEMLVLAYPAVAGWAIAAIVAHDQQAFVNRVGLLLSLPFAEGLVFWLRERFSGFAAERGGVALRAALFDTVLRLPLRWHTATSTGATHTRLTADVTRLVEQVHFDMDALRAAISVTLIGLILGTSNPLLLAAVAAAAGFRAVQGLTTGRRLNRAGEGWAAHRERVAEHLRERLDVLPMIRASGSTHWESEQTRRLAVVRGRRAVRQRANAAADAEARSATAQAFSILLLYVTSCALLAARQVEVAAVVMAIGYTGRLTSAITDLTTWQRHRSDAKASAARLAELHGEQPEATGAGAVPWTVDSLDIRGLTYAYDSDTPVLRGVELSLRRGEVLALVGSSGAGKSTLTDVLLGLLPLAPGTVRLNRDVDLATLDLAVWRQRVAYVPQKVVLFTDGVAANLTYGVPDAHPDVVGAHARLMDLASVLHAPEVEDPREPPRASGGERQRVGLVRAALRPHPLLTILDEPTSALDAVTEASVLEFLRIAKAAGPVLLVTHRMSTLRHADRVAVLRSGRVVECGPVDDLLADPAGELSVLFAGTSQPVYVGPTKGSP